MRRSLQPDSHDPGFDAEVQRVRDAIIAEEAAEAKVAFHLRMRSRGIQDLALLRALELVPRQTFVPYRYADLAARDLALPIGCGQTLDEPWLVARMIAALAVEPGHRVLQIGAGTGYATAILAQLAHEVVALERYQSLASSAQQRLDTLGIVNARVAWADGLALPPDVGVFQRIVVHGLLAALPAALTARLADGGKMVCARPVREGQAIMRVTKGPEGLIEAPISTCRVQPIVPGLAASL